MGNKGKKDIVYLDFRGGHVLVGADDILPAHFVSFVFYAVGEANYASLRSTDYIHLLYVLP